jgi:hypothetical protein
MDCYMLGPCSWADPSGQLCVSTRCARGASSGSDSTTLKHAHTFACICLLHHLSRALSAPLTGDMAACRAPLHPPAPRLQPLQGCRSSWPSWRSRTRMQSASRGGWRRGWRPCGTRRPAWRRCRRRRRPWRSRWAWVGRGDPVGLGSGVCWEVLGSTAPWHGHS